MIKVRRYRWGNIHRGNTHHGFVVYLFGFPVWRHKRSVEQ